MALVACLLGVSVFLIGAARGQAGFRRALTITGNGNVSFSAIVHPDGHRTTAYFEYGLDARYREPRPKGVVYDYATPSVHLAADFGSDLVSGRAAGLLPHARYHVRLVASNPAGTVYTPDSTFTTARDPAPRRPRLGATVNAEPLSGLVLFQRPLPATSPAFEAAARVAGSGYLPLTQKRQLSIDAHIDARAGAVRVAVARPQRGHTQRITLAGSLLSLSQVRHGGERGLTSLSLLEGDFVGAPTYGSSVTLGLANSSDARARTAQSSSLVIQTLRARDLSGRFRILGRYSAATADAGAVWDTVDRCDGTMTVVHRGTVRVSDFALGTTVAVGAGQSYLVGAH